MEKLYKYLIFFVFFIPAYIFRDYTPTNELKYISIAYDALAKGNFFTFYDHGVIYADKPPLYLWIIMCFKQIFGYVSPFMMSFFSILPSYIILILMDKWTGTYLDKDERTGAATMLITTIIYLGATLTVRMDMLMVMFIVLSLYCFYRIYAGEKSSKFKWGLSIFIFLALFTKGPVGILVPVLSSVIFLAYKKQLRSLKNYFGIGQIVLFALLLIAWFSATYKEGGSQYLNDLLIKQTVGRSINAYVHNKPFYYYLGTIWYTFVPWILFYLTSVFLVIYKRLIKNDLQQFFLIIVGSTFTIMSFVSSKIDIYLLPIYPFVTYLCLSVFKEINKNKWIKASVLIPASLFSIALPAYFIIGKNYIPNELVGDWKIISALSCLSLASVVAIVNLLKKGNLLQSVRFVSFGLLFFILISSFSIPKINHNIGYRELAKKADSISKSDQVYTYYKSNSLAYLDVYTSHPIIRIDILDSLHQPSLRKPVLLIAKENVVKREKNNFENITSDKQRYSIGQCIIFSIIKIRT